MPVTDVRKDTDTLTMTLTAEFDAPIERVWQLWADARQLERWWGPPTYPATFVDHDLVAGGVSRYFMTGPDGDRHHGWWRILSVDAPKGLSCQDGFGDRPEDAVPELPVTTMRVELGDRPGGGTAMVVESVFPSLEDMERLVEMGMEEGITLAMGQMDAILDED